MLKTPFNYIGGKYKLLPQIIDKFTNIDVFYDIFGGGGDISFNINSNQTILFDKNRQLINIYQHLDDTFIPNLEKLIKDRQLSKINKDGFLELRKYYNEKLKDKYNKEAAVVCYCLLCHSFNNFISFNKKSEFNVPFGMKRSTFNPSMKKNLQSFIEHKKNKTFSFVYSDFNDIKLDKITDKDLVYLDPPYLITTGSYERSAELKWNEEKELKWNEEKELELYEFIKKLDKKEIRFILSNVIEHKGKMNSLLINFVNENDLIMKQLDFHYKNCSYQSKNEEKKTIEVLISNF